ncbi:site-specific DNA-methyltransferase [Candidatus Micrarchaeota archaeon]|nr:site-specific DNA-methyltransferase [Candidatus Micrarchaeota archaeon]
MKSKHMVVIGDAYNMAELDDESIQLVVTSPPYFNVKDYGTENIGSIDSYASYLKSLRQVFEECYRVLAKGRYACINISDIISDRRKYPLHAHCISILQRCGFKYVDNIIWKKPSGRKNGICSGASKRFGLLIQHPYPMYYYPNNTYEHILVFRKGDFDYKTLTHDVKEDSKINIRYARLHWNTDIWEMMPETRKGHPAMFPEQLPEALIRLYTYKGEAVLDPFLGSGTTSAVAKRLSRSSIGYEINEAYLDLIKRKTGYHQDPHSFEILIKKPRGEMI